MGPAEVLGKRAKEFPGIAKRMTWATPNHFATVKIPVAREPGKYSLFIFPTEEILTTNFPRSDLTGLRKALSDPSIARLFIEIRDISELEDRAKNMIERLIKASDMPHREVAITKGLTSFTELKSYYALHQWVFHRGLAEKVLSGRFKEITPITSEFVPTLNCTFRCQLCSYEIQKLAFGVLERNDVRNPKAHMDWETMEISTKKLNKAGVKGLIYTGGGEPTFHADLIGGMRLARKLGIDIGLFTNGSILTPEKIKEFIELDPTFVRVSLNCGTEETHREYHRYKEPEVNFFEMALRTIELIAEEKIKRRSSMSFGVAFLTHKANENELPATAERLLEIVRKTGGGIDFVVYRPAVDYYHGTKIDPDFLEHTEQILFKDVKPKFEEVGIKFNYLGTRARDMKRGKTYSSCIANGAYGEVGPDGSMYLCCEKNVMPQFLIGDLKTSSLLDIWGGKARRDLIRWVNERNLDVCPSVCKPHELNKVFHKIQELYMAGEKRMIEQWMEDLQDMPKPMNVNFL